MKTNISVVIPCYNEEANIQACLDALVVQLRPGDEVLVVDNNSTDATVAQAQAYRGVKVLFESTQGQVFAQARGFSAAKNDIIARIDADSIVGYDWLEQVRRSVSTDTPVVTGPGTSYDLVTRIIPDWTMGFWTFKTNKFISGHYPVWGSNFAFTPSAWELIRTDMRGKQDVWEDFEIGILLHKHKQLVSYLPDLIVGYSNRNAANAKILDSIAYQYKASRTYWLVGSKRVACLSAVERTCLLAVVGPLVLFERSLQFALRRGRFSAGRRAALLEVFV